MTNYPAGRLLGGTGKFLGPKKNEQFNMVVAFIKAQLPEFVKIALEKEIDNENGLNSLLSRFITNAAEHEIFFANRESMENETKGTSPAVDIGIYLKINDTVIDPPLITVFEGKRLSDKLPKKRHREYVIGHVENGKRIHCGGIERFKLAIHGSKLNSAGMIGYIQDGTPDDWQNKTSDWICNLCNHPFDPAWSAQEQLVQQQTKGQVMEYSSVVNRVDSKLHLTHLWVDVSKK